MNDMIPTPDGGYAIAAMSPEAIDKTRQLEADLLNLDQHQLAMRHDLHFGVYTRTLFLQGGQVLSSALMKVATTMIVVGNARIFIGEAAPLVLEGYNVITCSAGRKVAVAADGDVFMSTYFATEAKTREEAEREATDEILAEGLAVENITGE